MNLASVTTSPGRSVSANPPYIESLLVQSGYSSTLKTAETFRKALARQNIPPSIAAAKTKETFSPSDAL